MFGRLVDRESEWEDETFRPDTVLNHGDIISTDEYVLETIHTPGHASNHLCFYLEKYKCLLTGDHIMDGSTVVIAPPDGNMTEYIDSLKLLENYDISCFAPGHGNYMEDPSKTIKSIIRHRLSRESKVMRCVEKNKNSNIDQLLSLVYDDVPEMLHPIAKMSLKAHLIKLQEDGKIKNLKNDYFSS
jgi:glyoxylase-like metal-dependent hydrolase (beta-lactamase superfamily II)